MKCFINICFEPRVGSDLLWTESRLRSHILASTLVLKFTEVCGEISTSFSCDHNHVMCDECPPAGAASFHRCFWDLEPICKRNARQTQASFRGLKTVWLCSGPEEQSCDQPARTRQQPQRQLHKTLYIGSDHQGASQGTSCHGLITH